MEGDMSIRTPLTNLLGISHPILLAPMDLVADARLTGAVSAAGGLGILGGGYGDEHWLTRELGLLDPSEARFGVGFITWSMARQPKLLDLALERKPAAVMLSFGDPRPFVDRIKRTGAILICQIQSATLAREAAAAGRTLLSRKAAKRVDMEYPVGSLRWCRKSWTQSGPAYQSWLPAGSPMGADWWLRSCSARRAYS
jgi:NAD(P)H-dependent flavin oxidoreductase YrpB (nitropropane dioxygenase family)